MEAEKLKILLNQLSHLPINTFGDSEEYTKEKRFKNVAKSLGLKYELKSEKNKKIFILSRNNRIIDKHSTGLYPDNLFLGRRLCNLKDLCQEYLEINSIPVPKTASFQFHEYRQAIDFAKTLNTMIVMKPLNLLGSVGVFKDITLDSFEYYWKKSIELQQKRNASKNGKIIVQQQLQGFDLRLNVVAGKTISGILRLPSHIIGDGESSIEKLINLKNEERVLNPYLSENLIKFNDETLSYLKNSNYKLDDVIEEDKVIVINPLPATRFGAEQVNVTDLLSDEVLSLGERVVKAIPGLHTCGIDLMIEQLDSKSAFVIEVNKNPALIMCLNVHKGEPHEPLLDIYRTRIVDDKIINNEIQSLEDINDDEFKILLQRFKFLHDKDKYNSRIIRYLDSERLE